MHQFHMMRDAHGFLQTLALVFCVAALTTVVFHRLRQPVVFGYLLAGMIVGPHIPIPLVADEATVRTLSELGVILLMFSLGLEFSLRQAGAGSPARPVSPRSPRRASCSASDSSPARRSAGRTIESVFAGAMVAISSTTIIAKAFAEQGVKRPREGHRLRHSHRRGPDRHSARRHAHGIGERAAGSRRAIRASRLPPRRPFSSGSWGSACSSFRGPCVPCCAPTRPEMTLVASIGVCFAAALLALAFGYSVALGAFIAGSLVAESGEARTIERLVEPVSDLFVAIFFVSVGMLIDPRVLAEHWGAVAVLTVVVIVGKAIGGHDRRVPHRQRAPLVGAGRNESGADRRVLVHHRARSGLRQVRSGRFSIRSQSPCRRLTTLTTPWLIRAARPAALYLDRKLPKPVQTFVALYGSWIERLRETRPAKGGRIRMKRLVKLILVDTALLAFVIIGTAVEKDRFTSLMRGWLGVSENPARLAVVAASLAVALPLLAGLVRVTWRLAFVLAVRALPANDDGKVDFAQAPRASFVATLQIAMLLAISAPLLAISQLFLRGTPTFALLLVVGGVLAFSLWRSTRDLHGHARAGAEVIGAALSGQMEAETSPQDLSRTMDHVSLLLPGLGEPVPVRLSATSAAVGRTLAELNLRGLTGATVLCISRPGASEQQSIVPIGKDRLRAGDIHSALAGSHDAVDGAREILEHG